jgi:hypothetical protein
MRGAMWQIGPDSPKNRAPAPAQNEAAHIF